jgi:hypothetical protein
MKKQNPLSPETVDALLKQLRKRFEENPQRHKGIQWEKVETKLRRQPEKLRVLNEMEESGGEPDVTAYDKNADVYWFTDCSAESPKGRRSLCYDEEALQSRKQHKPENSAMETAKEMGAELLTEEDYFALQKLGEFDLKTSSWLFTPEETREPGGALFGDRRFGRVFIYHNGAESYYAARGFRVKLSV